MWGLWPLASVVAWPTSSPAGSRGTTSCAPPQRQSQSTCRRETAAEGEGQQQQRCYSWFGSRLPWSLGGIGPLLLHLRHCQAAGRCWAGGQEEEPLLSASFAPRRCSPPHISFARCEYLGELHQPLPAWDGRDVRRLWLERMPQRRVADGEKGPLWCPTAAEVAHWAPSRQGGT